jgi:BirA family biotin operon repressor/biotin-[acetyl-CoA-carboxylase] ligase
MTTESIDRDRPALSAAALTRALVRPDGLWRAIMVTPETGSTNADLMAAARGSAPEGLVLIADAQAAGRGRLGRRWVSPPRAALMVSVLLRPSAVPAGRRGWLPLLAGVAVASAVRGAAAVDARLKWPNDVLAGERKLAGILAEQSGDAVVVGIGINVSTRRDELPVTGATSLLLEGAAGIDRDRVARHVLGEFERRYLAWARAPDAGGLRDEYLRLCATLGRVVRVEMPGGQVLSGTAADIDPDGRLLVSTTTSSVAVSAGDVIHVR